MAANYVKEQKLTKTEIDELEKLLGSKDDWYG